jgi:hypothetical protein
MQQIISRATGRNAGKDSTLFLVTREESSYKFPLCCGLEVPGTKAIKTPGMKPICIT